MESEERGRSHFIAIPGDLVGICGDCGLLWGRSGGGGGILLLLAWGSHWGREGERGLALWRRGRVGVVRESRGLKYLYLYATSLRFLAQCRRTTAIWKSHPPRMYLTSTSRRTSRHPLLISPPCPTSPTTYIKSAGDISDRSSDPMRNDISPITMTPHNVNLFVPNPVPSALFEVNLALPTV